MSGLRLRILLASALTTWFTACVPATGLPTTQPATPSSGAAPALTAAPSATRSQAPSPVATAGEGTTIATPSPTLKPPDDQPPPTAGACPEADGPVAVVQINPDVPVPRCRRVRPEQVLRVVNTLDRPVRVQLAHIDATIGPHEERTFDQPFGTYLAPGIHHLKISAYNGAAELWL